MADIINAELPDNREPAKLGALRIREIRALLNLTIAKLFDAAGNTIAGCIDGTFLAADSVTRTKIQDGEVIGSKLAVDSVASAHIASAQVRYGHLDANMVNLMPKAFGYVTERLTDGACDLQDTYGIGIVSRATAGTYIVAYDYPFSGAPSTVVFQSIMVTPRKRIPAGSDSSMPRWRLTAADNTGFTVYITDSGGNPYDIPFSVVVFSTRVKPVAP